MIGIVKSDNRFKELSKCVNSIYSDELVDFFNIDILVLPIKGIDSNGFINNHLNIIDILKNNKIKRIITGLANDYLKELSREYSIELTILMNERSFVDGNSRLTALGIYSYLLNNKKLNKDIIIIGFGNISFYLASLFKLFNIKFSIYTPNIIEQKCTFRPLRALFWQYNFCSAREQVASATCFFSASCASCRRLFLSQDAISCERTKVCFAHPAGGFCHRKS